VGLLLLLPAAAGYGRETLQGCAAQWWLHSAKHSLLGRNHYVVTTAVRQWRTLPFNCSLTKATD
jgi:hypothetical protein